MSNSQPSVDEDCELCSSSGRNISRTFPNPSIDPLSLLGPIPPTSIKVSSATLMKPPSFGVYYERHWFPYAVGSTKSLIFEIHG